MKPLLLLGLLLYVLSGDNCGTGGSIQDANHTESKRQVDAEDAQPTPTPFEMRTAYAPNFPAAEYDAQRNEPAKPKMPQRPGKSLAQMGGQ